MRIPLLAVALLLMGAQARAAAVLYERDPEIRAKTMQLLAEKNGNYREQAENLLKGKGHFDRQRVEITGMLSADDTRRIAPADFDDYIKPSVKADKGRTIGDWFNSWRGKDYDLDMAEMGKAMRGEMSVRAVATVAAFKDMEINEIVAHSWGCELVYAAILNGEMRPPKKLIVVGVPDDDRAKWALLAARTGTEVFWGRAGNDAAALDKGVISAKKAAKDVDFEAKWDAACDRDRDSENPICPAHGRRPKTVVVIPVGNLPARPPLFLAHDREDYYDRVRAEGYFKGTAQQLMVADNKRVVREMDKVEQDALNAAHKVAIELIAQARAQAEIAQRDHDERLRNTIADMARRSCESPGSVTQTELDNLPDPYNQDFVAAAPRGIGECGGWVYINLSRGVDAMKIQELSTPKEAAAAKPVPQPAQLNVSIKTNFLSMLPSVKDFAVASCRSPGQVTLPENITRPYGNIRFSPTGDEREAVRLSAGLGQCEGRLFKRLVEWIRGGYGPNVSSEWLKDAVREFTPPADSNDDQTIVSPPFQKQPGGDPCRDHGNIRCP